MNAGECKEHFLNWCDEFLGSFDAEECNWFHAQYIQVEQLRDEVQRNGIKPSLRFPEGDGGQ